MIKHVSKLVLGTSLITSMFIGSTALASASEDNYVNPNARNQPVMINEQQNVMPITINEDMPDLFANHVALNGPINNSGNTWLQPAGYNYVRINVQNTGNQTLKVFVREDNYPAASAATIAPKSSATWTSAKMNISKNTKFTLEYSSPNGVVSGTATVRVSNTPL